MTLLPLCSRCCWQQGVVSVGGRGYGIYLRVCNLRRARHKRTSHVLWPQALCRYVVRSLHPFRICTARVMPMRTRGVYHELTNVPPPPTLVQALRAQRAAPQAVAHVTAACAARAAAGSLLNAFVTYGDGNVPASAPATRGPYASLLQGVPLATKANILAQGMPATAASCMLSGMLLKQPAALCDVQRDVQRRVLTVTMRTTAPIPAALPCRAPLQTTWRRTQPRLCNDSWMQARALWV